MSSMHRIMFVCMCVHSCLKRHAPWAIMCCPLLYLEPNSQHMDTNWALASTISAPAPVWPPSLLPPLPILHRMFVPVAPYLHATLKRRGVSLAGQTEGFSENFPPLSANKHKQILAQKSNRPFHQEKRFSNSLLLKVNSGVMPFSQSTLNSIHNDNAGLTSLMFLINLGEKNKVGCL